MTANVTGAAAFPAPIDAYVVERAKLRDDDAISVLYDACYPRVFHFCLARLRDPELASDAASDVFERMLRALPDYRMSGVPFEAWLFRIARNRVIDIVRRTARWNEGPINESSVMGVRDKEYERIVDRDLIDRVLSTLNATQRQVIVMRFLDGHDVGAVASAIGRSREATKSIQFRAVAAMRRALLDSGASLRATSRPSLVAGSPL